MQSATYVALSRQSVLDRTISVIANNIANVSTPGFRGENAMFHEQLARISQGNSVSYVADGGVVRDTRPGALSRTGNPLDTAIDGTGFYTVDTPDGPRYTRNGRFQLDPNRQLVTSQGYPVLSDAGQPIVVPLTTRTIDIAPSGTVGTENGPVGKIGLSQFSSPQTMTVAADGLYVTDDQPTADTTSKVQQGTVEDSNVQPIVEITKLMGLQRAYESAQQIIEGEDNRIRNAIDKLSRSV